MMKKNSYIQPQIETIVTEHLMEETPGFSKWGVNGGQEDIGTVDDGSDFEGFGKDNHNLWDNWND